MARQGLQSLFLAVVLLVSCEGPNGDNPEEGCGGTGGSVSCLSITTIEPTSTAGGESSNVDAFQQLCREPESGAITAEEFTDHNATVTFTNTAFPTSGRVGVDTPFDIRITSYSVSYRLNQCPAAAQGCPPLTGFTVTGQSLLVPAGDSAQLDVPLVPLRVKNEFCNARGEVGTAIPSYTAVYTFSAQTTRFNENFTVTGSQEFTIGNFLDDGFTCAGTILFAGC
jgi:hypothetical protein